MCVREVSECLQGCKPDAKSFFLGQGSKTFSVERA